MRTDRTPYSALLAMMVLMVVPAQALAGPHLTTTLSADRSAGPTAVKLVIVNSGDAPAFILEMTLPFVGRSGVVIDNPLEVISASGEKAEFTGPMTDRESPVVPVTEQLAARGQKTMVIDAAKSYELLPATMYAVRLRTGVYYMDEDEVRLANSEELPKGHPFRKAEMTSGQVLITTDNAGTDPPDDGL